MDFLLEKRVVLELKMADTSAMVHFQPVLTYLHLGH